MVFYRRTLTWKQEVHHLIQYRLKMNMYAIQKVVFLSAFESRSLIPSDGTC